jgi:hypothetical protein
MATGGKKGNGRKSGAKPKGPQKLRAAGSKAVELASRPAVSETVAAALLAAAAALRDPPTARRAASKAADAAADAGKQALSLGDSLRAFAIDVARRTLDAWEQAESSIGNASSPRRGRD